LQGQFGGFGHAAGIGVEEALGELAEEVAGESGVGGPGGEGGGASFDEGLREGVGAEVALGGEEDEIDGPDELQVGFAEEGAEGVAELLHFGEAVAGGFVAGVGDDVQGAGAVVGPVGGGGQRGEERGYEKGSKDHITIVAKQAVEKKIVAVKGRD